MSGTRRPPFEFGLRTLLLLFVVLGSSIAVFGIGGIGAFAVVFGLAFYVRNAKSFSRILLVLIGLCLVLLLGLLPLVTVELESYRDLRCWHKLTNVSMALEHYRTPYGHYPPACVVDKTGKRMHSWRVLILPFMGYEQLYKAYDFSQPWDAPKNKKLLAERPYEYFCDNDPGANASGATQTSYLAVVGPDTAWTDAQADKRAGTNFHDHESSTIMLVEANNSNIEWTEPRDFSLDSLDGTGGTLSGPKLSSSHGACAGFFFGNASHVNVAIADAMVDYLRTANLPPDELRKILQIGGFTEDVISKQTDVQSARHLNWPNIAALIVWLVSVGALLTSAVRGRAARAVTA